MISLSADYVRQLNARNTQVVGEDIPPIESVFDLKSGVVEVQEYRSDWIEWSEVKFRIAAK
jgi:hypothetical protein